MKKIGENSCSCNRLEAFNGGRVWITSRNDGDPCCNVMMPINTMEDCSALVYVLLMYLDDVFIVIARILLCYYG